MRVNRIKAVLLTATAAGALAGGLLADDFNWSGNGVDDAYFHHCNWQASPFCPSPSGPWPDDNTDTATFPWNASGPWAVDLVTVTNNILTIQGSVDFASFEPPPVVDPPVLTVTSLSIAPTQGAIEITIGDEAAIEVP